MRIAHVVSLFSIDGAFGGPSAVAIEQCQSLADLGHDVTLFAGWDGRALVHVPGVNLSLHPAAKVTAHHGFRSLVSPSLWRALFRQLRSFDVAHVHFGRDPVSALSGAISSRKIPTVLQPHGMVQPDARRQARIWDYLVIKPALSRAAASIALTDGEAADLRTISGGSPNVGRIRNGVRPLANRTIRRSRGDARTVVFCARLHPRKRVATFVEVASALAPEFPSVNWLVAGADEGQGELVRDYAARIPSLSYVGALSRSDARELMARADVVVLPSVDEPFPMNILEAMSDGTPCVVTTACGIADELRSTTGALVCAPELDAVITAARTLLSESTDQWESRSKDARTFAAERYSAQAVAQQLVRIYMTASRRLPSG